MAAHLVEAGWEVDVLSAARPGADRPYLFGPGVRVTPVTAPTAVGDAVDALGRLRRNVAGWLRPGFVRKDEKAAPTLAEPSAAPGPGTGPGLYGRLMGNVSAVSRWSAQLGWTRGAVRAGIELARGRPASVIAVSTPPHPTQLVGVRLSRALGVPYLADFRDPWLFGELDSTQSRLVDLRLGAWAQARTFAQTSRVVCNTDWAAETVVEHDPALAGRAVAIPNGYDPCPEIALPDTERFRVAFVGWLYDFMDPEPVLAACGRLRERERLDALRVEFVGTDEAPGGVSLHSRARAHGLEGCFEHQPRVPREEARQRQQRAAVQVVFDAPGPYRVPMKFYDSVQCRGDLLLLGSTPSAMADAAAQVGLTVCPPYDPGAIDAALTRALNRWRLRAYDSPVDASGIFARAHTGRRMQAELEALVNATAPAV